MVVVVVVVVVEVVVVCFFGGDACAGENFGAMVSMTVAELSMMRMVKQLHSLFAPPLTTN
jgi:hypothetical protein